MNISYVERMVLIFALTLVTPALYADNKGQCDSVLVEQTTTVSVNKVEEYAWLNLVNRINYETAKRSSQGQAYANMFGGSYDEFITKRTELFEKESYSSSINHSREEFKSFLTSFQVDAWRDCMVTKKPTIISYFTTIDKDSAVLVVEWNVSPAIGRLKSIETELFGSTSKKLMKLTNLVGEDKFTLFRKSTGSVIRGTISGNAGVNKQKFSTEYYLPKYDLSMKPTLTKGPVRKDGSTVGYFIIEGIKRAIPSNDPLIELYDIDTWVGVDIFLDLDKYQTGQPLGGDTKLCRVVDEDGIRYALWDGKKLIPLSNSMFKGLKLRTSTAKHCSV